VDRIVGLELGADDYLPKPFNPRELAPACAPFCGATSRARPSNARQEMNGVMLDPATRQVTVDGQAVDLTTFEFDILEMLMRAAGRVLSRDDLMENLYNRQATPFDRSIDMHISHLRKARNPATHHQDHPRRRLPVCARARDEARGMNSLFAKILLWFWVTLIINTIGSALIYALAVNTGPHRYPPLARLVTFQLEEARAAYESGGQAGLARFMQRFHTVFAAEGLLTDGGGRDLLTGADESGLVAKSRAEPVLPVFRRGGAVVARRAADGRYWFFFVVPPTRFGSWFVLPQHWWVMGAGIVLCYLLAFYLTQPVRQLQHAVERFGHGDFSARAASGRRDELGDLARTFDRMADRIQTLMAAEHRLLLDISHELRSPLARLASGGGARAFRPKSRLRHQPD
jgi:HAMP domain-containing protein